MKQLRGIVMVDFLIVIVLLVILGAAIIYIVKAKKSGTKCIGCSDSGSCAGCNGSCSGNTKCCYGKDSSFRR